MNRMLLGAVLSMINLTECQPSAICLLSRGRLFSHVLSFDPTRADSEHCSFGGALAG